MMEVDQFVANGAYYLPYKKGRFCSALSIKSAKLMQALSFLLPAPISGALQWLL